MVITKGNYLSRITERLPVEKYTKSYSCPRPIGKWFIDCKVTDNAYYFQIVKNPASPYGYDLYAIQISNLDGSNPPPEISWIGFAIADVESLTWIEIEEIPDEVADKSIELMYNPPLNIIPFIIVGGVLIVGGIGYLLTRKKV